MVVEFGDGVVVGERHLLVRVPRSEAGDGGDGEERVVADCEVGEDERVDPELGELGAVDHPNDEGYGGEDQDEADDQGQDTAEQGGGFGLGVGRRRVGRDGHGSGGVRHKRNWFLDYSFFISFLLNY